MTDADEAHYEKYGVGKMLREAKELKKSRAPYFPFDRRGDYVVTGEHDLGALPAGATRAMDKDGATIPNAFDFDSREAAHAYVANQKLPSRVKQVYFDPDGNLTTKEGAITSDMAPEDGAPKYRVTVENRHVEFAKSEAEANQIHDAMIEAGIKNVKPVDMVTKHNKMDFGLRSGQVNALAQAIDRRTDMTEGDKARMIHTLEQVSVPLQRGNRLESHYIERRGVSGMSTDVIRNFSDYAHASAAFRARGEFKPDIDAAFKDMQRVVDDGRTNGDTNTVERRRWLQEMQSRLEGFGSPEYSGKLAPIFQGLATISFLKRMLSPAHLALHLTHPVMISGPEMGGRYGLNNAYRELFKAYNDLGARGALGEGVKGMTRVARTDGAPTDFGSYFRKQVNDPTISHLFAELEATGHIHPSAAFDVTPYTETQNSFERGLGRVDRSFRELTNATETVNRYASALTEFRLAKRNGLSDEAAIRSAKNMLASTQGLYSQTNAPPIFRNPYTRFFLQFKQLPVNLATLIGRLVYNSFRGETPEVRQAALRSFGSMMGAAALMSGVGGLPQDIEKLVLGLGRALGVGPDWETAQSEQRMALAHTLGPELAKLVMGGVTGMSPFGVNVGHRMGYASLLTFGQPKSEKEDDLMAWIGDTLMGAPGSLIGDTADGLFRLRNGDYVNGVAKLAPAKIVGDIAKAYELYNKASPTSA
jgi:hypothetical protein